jgi:hypothetical protein
LEELKGCALCDLAEGFAFKIYYLFPPTAPYDPCLKAKESLMISFLKAWPLRFPLFIKLI